MPDLPVWRLTLGLQGLIFVACIAIGVMIFRMRWTTAMLATALAMPVALFKVSPGAAGFVFVADLAALFFVGRILLKGVPHTSGRSTWLPHLVLALTVILPGISTVVGGFFHPDYRSFNEAALLMARGVAFYCVYYWMMHRGREEERPDDMLALGCIAFSAVCLLGLAQQATGVNLDLWNEIRRIDFGGEETGGLGGGFMGLYRGAIGGWGAGVLAVIPIVFLNRRLGTLLISLMSIVILGAILSVGSRQGLIFGIFGFLVGLAMAARNAPPDERVSQFVRTLGGLAIAGVIGMVAWGSLSSFTFRKYVLNRFDFESASFLVQQAQARDPRMGIVVNKVLGEPYMFIIGSGYGAPRGEGFPVGWVYVDSEILYVWQIGGTGLVICYIGYIIAQRLHLRRGNLPAELPLRHAASAGVATLYVGILFLYGHFYLMTGAPHQAPIAYWNWMVLGLATGVCTRQPAGSVELAGADDGSEAEAEDGRGPAVAL